MTRQPTQPETEDDGPRLTLVSDRGSASPTGLTRLADAYLRQRKELKAFLNRLVRDNDTSEDLLHDIWLRIGRLRETDAPKEPDAYLRTVARNIATDWLRRRSTRNGILSDATDVDHVADISPAADDALLSREALDCLLKIIEGLAPRQRQALLLYRVEGWSMAEVARHMGISARTVEEHVSRAIAHCDFQMTRAGWLP